MVLAIIGATGMVGRVMLQVLEEREIKITKLILVASKKSFKKQVFFRNKKYKIICIEELYKHKVDLALFSAGSDVSKEWAPKLADKGCKVIDNSSYWRMSSKHKLIVPEINGHKIQSKDMIIANPNCSTIQLVMVLAPLHRAFTIKRVVVSTYQSVTGTGKKAVNQLESEERGVKHSKIYPHQIYNNILPHCDSFENNGYTKEEMKIENETKKIIDDKINITATAVRVPVCECHSESVNITFEKEYDLLKVREILKKEKGVLVFDSISKNEYPMPILAKGKDDVFVGRIRRDMSTEKALNLWIVSDNLRKGAATNSIQIAEHLIKNKFV